MTYIWDAPCSYLGLETAITEDFRVFLQYRLYFDNAIASSFKVIFGLYEGNSISKLQIVI